MEVDLHITNRCNLYCKHCVYDSGSLSMTDMSLATVKTLVNGFKRMGVDEVHLTGGEPLLNKDFFNITSYLNAHNFKVRMQTNGFLIDESIAKKVKDSGIEYVLISVDGLKDFHNSFRNNKYSFDKAIEAIKFFKSVGVFTRVNTVVSKGNINNIEKIIEIINSLDINQHSFFYLTPNGRGRNLINDVLSLEEWRNVKDIIENTAKRINCMDKIRIQDVFREKNDCNSDEEWDTCRNDNCLILANGNVYHCVLFANTEYFLGNIYKQDIFNIWNEYPNIISKIKTDNNSFCKRYFDNKSIGCLGLVNQLSNSKDICERCNINKNLVSNCIRRYI